MGSAPVGALFFVGGFIQMKCFGLLFSTIYLDALELLRTAAKEECKYRTIYIGVVGYMFYISGLC